MIKKTKIETKEKPKTKSAGKTVKNPLTFIQEIKEQKDQLPTKSIQSVLKTRGQALALGKIEHQSQKETIEIIEFQLASERYAIETAFVREVYPMKDFAILPGLPTFVTGIINVRGQIISVINLKKFFNLPEKGLGELNKVIIIQNKQMEFGILADVIHGTYSLPIDTIQNTLSNKNAIGNDYLKGVTSNHLIVLDANKILKDEKIIINQETE